MTAQLLDYPTTASARARQASGRAGVTIAPHRQAPRRPHGPTQRSWAMAVPAAPSRGRAEVSAPSAPVGRLYWTPRGLAVMVAFVAAIALAMTGTLLVAFLAVSPAPIDAAPAAAGVPAPVLAAAVPVAGLG